MKEHRSSSPIKISLQINNQPLQMEVDTGAAVSLISQRTHQEYLSQIPLEKSDILLKTYTGEQVPVLGKMKVRVSYLQQSQELWLEVVTGKGPNLMGRNWLKKMKLNLAEINNVSTSKPTLESLMQKFGEIFNEELGTIKTFHAELQVREGEKPRFFKPRSIPYAVKGVIGKELDRLEEEGILEKIDHSDWASPIVAVMKRIVAVMKPNGKYWICGDFKVTVNQALMVNQYPLPNVEDLFTTLAGGKKFTKLDLSQAYLQLQLEPESQKYCTINTHQGLYHFNRLPFGISSAPAIFQKIMDTILQGIPQTLCYIDDILVTGANDEEHLKNLAEVFERLHKYGYDIEFRSTKGYGNVDALSRLPLQDSLMKKNKQSDTHICNIQQIERLPVTSQTVGIATRRDPILSNVHSYLLKGWPEVIPPELRQYYSRMAELSVEGKCVLWGNRVIIPKTLQNRLLQDLHREHMGI